MNENKNRTYYKDDVIDIKDIFISLWKQKTFIISITLVMALLTALFSMFIITPVYQTKLNIVISMPETFSTRFGDYPLPITTNEQYIRLFNGNDVLVNTMEDMGSELEEVTVDDLRESINIIETDVRTGTIQNTFQITVSADSPEKSLKLAQTLYNNYIKYMEVMINERAVNYYYNDFNVEVKSLKNSLIITQETLKKNKELLSQIPKVIDNGDYNIEIQTKLTNDSEYIIPVRTINPNYIKIENDIVENNQTINELENNIIMYNNYIKELEVEKQAIDSYYKSGHDTELKSSIVSIIDTNIYLSSFPVAPTKKTSPSNSMNTIVGSLMGGMIGVTVALVRRYWFR